MSPRHAGIQLKECALVFRAPVSQNGNSGRLMADQGNIDQNLAAEIKYARHQWINPMGLPSCMTIDDNHDEFCPLFLLTADSTD